MRKNLRGMQMKGYEPESRLRYGNTAAYREHEQKTQNCVKGKRWEYRFCRGTDSHHRQVRQWKCGVCLKNNGTVLSGERE